MSARQSLLRLVLVAAAFLSFDAGARPFTVTDQLKIAMIGRQTAVDPSGRWIIWEQTPPYERFPDYGITRFNTLMDGGAHLMAVDLSAAHPTAAPLFAADPQRSYWLEGFSPSGRYLLFYTSKAGKVQLGAYDFELRKVKSFDVAPAVRVMGGHRSVWTSKDEFVFSALPEGDQPANISLRRYTGERLSQEWQKAWRGVEPTGSEVDSHVQDVEDAFLQGRLFRANARTGVLTQLADGLYETLVPSNDGRYLAGLRQLRQVQPRPGVANLDWVTTRSQLYLFDLQRGGAAKRLAPEKDVYPLTLVWAGDSPRLSFFAWDKGAGVRKGIFQVLDASNGTITPYPHTGLDLVSERERGIAEKPERTMWIDGKLAVFAREQPDPHAPARFTYTSEDSFRAFRATPPHWYLLNQRGESVKLSGSLESISPIPVNADEHSLTVLAKGGVWKLAADQAPQNLASSGSTTWAYPSEVRYSEEHDAFRSTAAFADEKGVVLLDRANNAVSVVKSPDDEALFLAGSAQRHVALYRDKKNGVMHLILRDADGHEQELERLNEHLASITPSTWLPFKYTVQSHLGPRELESCALLPPDYQPGRRYPLIVEVYPDVHAHCRSAERRSESAVGEMMLPWDENIFAARGYITVRATEPGELIRTADGPINGMPDVVLPAVDALVAQGYVDGDRVALWGESQGGFSSLWVATQTPRFKAVVSAIGWSDMYSHYFEGILYNKFYPDAHPYTGEGTRYEIEGGDFGLGVSPYVNPEKYIRNSPLFHASQINSPLLLIQSDLDAFSLNQYEMLFTALYNQRKEVKFLRYWGEGHGPSSPANIRQSTAAMLAWYDQWLDVSRDDDGNVIWTGERLASRGGAPARTTEWFIENDRRIAR